MRKIFERFTHDQEGALTSFGLFMLMASLVIGGLALDVANAYMARTQLQATADAVAHAALYTRDVTQDEAVATSAGLDLAEKMMPAAKFGNTINASDIKFGTWDSATRTFSASPGADDAVFVDMSRAADRANPVATYFLSFAGMGQWDVRRGSVYETYRPTCFREGFVANDVVDIQSNNSFHNGFCIHSNQHVEVNNNGYWETGTIVSMPDKRDIVLPNSGYSSSPGLKAALRDGAYRMRILNELQDIIEGIRDLDQAILAKYVPSYITNRSTTISLGRSLADTDFVPGNIHVVTCTAAGHKINFSANATLQNVVLVTNCPIHFAQGGTLINSIIATTNTKDSSIYAGNLFTIGADDNCAVGGGANVLTLGGVDFSAGLQAFGGQILAIKDIEFAANANGIEGASFISYGTISGTSNMSMGFCGDGMEYNFEAEYFRMAG